MNKFRLKKTQIVAIPMPKFTKNKTFKHEIGTMEIINNILPRKTQQTIKTTITYESILAGSLIILHD